MLRCAMRQQRQSLPGKKKMNAEQKEKLVARLRAGRLAKQRREQEKAELGEEKKEKKSEQKKSQKKKASQKLTLQMVQEGNDIFGLDLSKDEQKELLKSLNELDERTPKKNKPARKKGKGKGSKKKKSSKPMKIAKCIAKTQKDQVMERVYRGKKIKIKCVVKDKEKQVYQGPRWVRIKNDGTIIKSYRSAGGQIKNFKIPNKS